MFDKSFIKLGHELAHAWDELIGKAGSMHKTNGGVKNTEVNAVRFENYLRAMLGETDMRMQYGGVNINFSGSSTSYFKNYIAPLKKDEIFLRIDPSPPPQGIIRDATNVRKNIYMPYDTRTQKFVFK